MAHLLFWIGFLLIYNVDCQTGLKPKLPLDNFEISLFSEDLILSTIIWLQPPSCLYEEWMSNALDTSVATRKTSSIQVEVQIEGRNETYVVPDLFRIPQCKTMFGEPPPTEVYVFQVGPNLSDKNNTQIIRILPGTAYKVRYVLYNDLKNTLAYTDWSDTFKTSLPQSPRETLASLQGRSGGMVVITVLLSISMFMLLVGLAVTFATHK